MSGNAGPRGGGDSFGQLEAQSLYCPRCGRAQPVRSKLLLVLPNGEKHAYFCRVCGEEVGSKMQEHSRPVGWSGM